MFRPLSRLMLAAVPAAALLISPLTADAEWKEIGSKRAVGQRTSHRPYNDFYRGPPVYNTSRLSFRVPRYNPYPVYGYYGSQQYSSMWVPGFFYSFR